ncbi:unnamed protein product [Arabis nemorensis]|uniref:FBD domain-containing protein n=1 Tax=Arabis nemorensis TaxID=586526 RepID=A0A565AR59_9BRAS|nr:unnamed protein product [Arabis nemorensis]
MLPEDVSLPSLKTLFLDSVYFYNSSYCVLCPLLEELTIHGDCWQLRKCSRTVSSSTLKKLTIMCTNREDFWGITFDTPNLAYLEYSDLIPRDYPFVNLESLVELKLDLYLCAGHSNPTNLLKGLRNVEALELSSNDTSRMIYHFREVIPVFNILFRLSITTHSLGYDWEVLPILLKNSPNLQTLVIKGPLDAEKRKRGRGYVPSCPVKVLKITERRQGKVSSHQRFANGSKIIQVQNPDQSKNASNYIPDKIFVTSWWFAAFIENTNLVASWTDDELVHLKLGKLLFFFLKKPVHIRVLDTRSVIGAAISGIMDQAKDVGKLALKRMDSLQLFKSSISLPKMTPILWSHAVDDKTEVFEAGQAGLSFLQEACELKACPDLGFSISNKELQYLESWIKQRMQSSSS